MKSAHSETAGETPVTDTRANTRGNCRQCAEPVYAAGRCKYHYQRDWYQRRRADRDTLAVQRATMMLEPCPPLSPRARRLAAVELARRGRRVDEIAWYLSASQRTIWRALHRAGVAQPRRRDAATLPTISRAVLPAPRRDSVAS